MPCAYDTKDKGSAIKAVTASLDCGAFTSVLAKKDGNYAIYPRVKQQDKEAFYQCVQEKGIQFKGEWLRPKEESK